MDSFVNEVTNELSAAGGVAALLIEPIDESIREAKVDGLHGGPECLASVAFSTTVSRMSHEPMESPGKMPCRSCGAMLQVQLRPDTRHYGEIRCPIHGHQWIAKPENEKRPRRKANRKLLPLIDEDRRDWCWSCLRTSSLLSELQPSLELQVHHVIEVADGGTDELCNLQVLCEECHSGIHRDRERYARYA